MNRWDRITATFKSTSAAAKHGWQMPYRYKMNWIAKYSDDDVDKEALQEAIERYNADLLPGEDRMTIGEYIAHMKTKGAVPKQ